LLNFLFSGNYPLTTSVHKELESGGEDYSTIRHIASILAPRLQEWGEVSLVMLSAAFDASGDEGLPILTVAGFVSSAKDWESFSKLWKERLSREGIEYFRAAEAAHFRKQFRPWLDDPNREKWRQNLFADLMDILKRHVYRKFGCTILNKHFGSLSQENQDTYKLRAYSVAGRTCDKQVRVWAFEERIKTPIELVFEAGDAGRHELNIRLVTDTARIPVFRPKKDMVNPKTGVIEYGFVPLQAADWLAYEVSDAHDTFEKGTLEQFRWAYQEFDGIRGEVSTYTERDLVEMDKMLTSQTEITQFSEKLSRLKKG
jgi:hypothetical protein